MKKIRIFCFVLSSCKHTFWMNTTDRGRLMRCRILFRWTKKRETKTKTSRARAALCSSLIMYPKYKRLQWRDEWCKTIIVVSDIMCMTCSLAEGYSNNTAQTTIWLQRHRLMYWSKTSKAPHMELMEWVAFWISQKNKNKTKPKKKKKRGFQKCWKVVLRVKVKILLK